MKSISGNPSESRVYAAGVRLTGRARVLSVKKITARRHELFEVFASESLKVVKDDPAGACKLAETALKALSGPEHEPPISSASVEANPLSGFEEELDRAYATE